MDNCQFYLLAIAYLLSSYFHKITTSMDSGNGLRKKFIESSNNETFSFTTLSSDDPDPPDTNETWRVTNFQIRNITTLLSEYPLVSQSLPAKNSSRYFCTKRSSASLTLSIKSFKHGVMFLNFSYFIGKTRESEPQEINDTISDESQSALPNSMEIIEKEATTELNPPQSKLEAIMENAPSPSITLKTLESELNHSPVSISISSLPNYQEGEVPELLTKPEIHRKRRSVILETISPSGTPSMPAVDDGSGNEIKLEQLMTTDKTDNLDLNGSISSPSLTVAASSSNNVTNAIDSLTLVQAVEMIKTAAAAISKGSVVSTGPALDATATNKPDENLNSIISNGSSLDLSLLPTEKSALSLPAAQESTENPKVVSTSINDIKESESAEIEMTHHHHHKSKNGSNKSFKSEHKKRRNRGKKVDSVERTEKDGDSDDDDDNNDHGSRSSSTSSSSSSSEEEIDEHAEKKPKISYKMWRASLEKKNRPPGLYVTVNDDIIFDNWEGIWDKHFVLGKWTGSKTLISEDWNQTSLFMNWDAESTGRDLKITFEWEPVEDYELLLADIDISTMISSEIPSCTSPPQTWSNDESYSSENNDQLGQIETPEKISSALDLSNEGENQTSIIVLKQSKNGKKGWEIVRAGTAQPSTWGKIDNLELHQLPDSNQVKLGTLGATNPEDILHEILERLHTNIHADMAPAQSIPTTENAAFTPPKETPSFVDHIMELEVNPSILEANNTSTVSARTILLESSAIETATITDNTVDTMTSNVNIVSSLETSSTSNTITNEGTVTNIQTTIVPAVTNTPNNPNPSGDNPSSLFDSLNLATPTNTPVNENMNTQPIFNALPIRKTDKETALLVSVFTGSIALVILVLTVKKRMDISSKGRNANR